LGAVAEAEFIDADGTVRREPLNRCWSVAFERVSPVPGVNPWVEGQVSPDPHPRAGTLGRGQRQA
jgi:hypothetical protein